MISQSLLSWQQSRKYRIDGDTVYGVSGGVGFSVVEEDGGKLAVFMLVCSSDASFDGMEDMLRSQPTLADLQVGDVEGYLALFYDESVGAMDEYMLDDMLTFVSANYRGLGFRAPNVCVKCGAPANKRSFYNNMVQPMCAECSAATKAGGRAPTPAPAPAPASAPRPEPRREQYQEDRLRTSTVYDEERDDTYAGMEPSNHRSVPTWEAEPPYQAGNDEGTAGKGVLGAVIGAVAGLVPFGISIVFGFPLPALCVLCGVLAIMGYVAFGGVKDKKTGSMASIVSAEIVTIVAVLLVFLLSKVGTTELLINIVLGVLGSFLGIALAIDSLNNYIQKSN